MSDGCYTCGGEMQAVTGPGRSKLYRGVRCEIPSDFAMPTCAQCGSEWVRDEDVSRLSDALESQRLAHEHGILLGHALTVGLDALVKWARKCSRPLTAE